jgi:hypothetical protein
LTRKNTAGMSESTACWLQGKPSCDDNLRSHKVIRPRLLRKKDPKTHARQPPAVPQTLLSKSHFSHFTQGVTSQPAIIQDANHHPLMNAKRMVRTNWGWRPPPPTETFHLSSLTVFLARATDAFGSIRVYDDRCDLCVFQHKASATKQKQQQQKDTYNKKNCSVHTSRPHQVASYTAVTPPLSKQLAEHLCGLCARCQAAPWTVTSSAS